MCSSKWTIARKQWAGLSLQFAAFVFLVLGVERAAGCGHYYSMGSSSSTGTLYSPNYPNMYPNYTRCIWLIEAPSSHRVKLNINFQGERYSGACSDNLEIRDGASSAQQIFSSCDTVSGQDVISGNRWMWVKFTTDGLEGSGTGLTATFTAHYNATVENSTNPVVECRSYQFECANKECLSMSYRCDDYNDCGCDDDCDEDECGGLPLSMPAQIGIGVGVGVCVFVIICVISLLIESRHKSWSADPHGQGKGANTAGPSASKTVANRTNVTTGNNATFVQSPYRSKASVAGLKIEVSEVDT